MMNTIYAQFNGPEAAGDGCPIRQYELELIGPVHGPERRPHPRVSRWSMSPAEWVGGSL